MTKPNIVQSARKIATAQQHKDEPPARAVTPLHDTAKAPVDGRAIESSAARATTGAPMPAVPQAPKQRIVKLADLERDASVNCRTSGVSERVATEYAHAMKAGSNFPAVIAFRDAIGKLWLADGFHRVRAHEIAGRTEIAVNVRDGDRRAALLFAAGANATHGARRTRADVRRAIEVVLADTEWRAKSDRWIAEVCAVHNETIAAARKRLTDSVSSPRTGKDGKTRGAPKRKASARKPNAARAVKVARRGLDRVARGWPKGEPVAPLVEAAKAWLASLEVA